MGSEKCIWMEAGVLDYQLCPLKHNCDVCDFHQEMIRGDRTHASPEEIKLLTKPPDPSLSQFLPGLQYLEGHLWYKRVGECRVRVGIDSMVWQLVTSVQKVVFPQPGGQVKREECFCWFLLAGGMVYLKTPYSGKIVNINPQFQTDDLRASQLYLTPEKELWLVELEIAEGDQLKSLSKDEYQNRVIEDCDRFSRTFHSEIAPEGKKFSRIAIDPRGEFRKYLQLISRGYALVC